MALTRHRRASIHLFKPDTKSPPIEAGYRPSRIAAFLHFSLSAVSKVVQRHMQPPLPGSS